MAQLVFEPTAAVPRGGRSYSSLPSRVRATKRIPRGVSQSFKNDTNAITWASNSPNKNATNWRILSSPSRPAKASCEAAAA